MSPAQPRVGNAVPRPQLHQPLPPSVKHSAAPRPGQPLGRSRLPLAGVSRAGRARGCSWGAAAQAPLRRKHRLASSALHHAAFITRCARARLAARPVSGLLCPFPARLRCTGSCRERQPASCCQGMLQPTPRLHKSVFSPPCTTVTLSELLPPLACHTALTGLGTA